MKVGGGKRKWEIVSLFRLVMSGWYRPRLYRDTETHIRRETDFMGLYDT